MCLHDFLCVVLVGVTIIMCVYDNKCGIGCGAEEWTYCDSMLVVQVLEGYTVWGSFPYAYAGHTLHFCLVFISPFSFMLSVLNITCSDNSAKISMDQLGVMGCWYPMSRGRGCPPGEFAASQIQNPYIKNSTKNSPYHFTNVRGSGPLELGHSGSFVLSVEQNSTLSPLRTRKPSEGLEACSLASVKSCSDLSNAFSSNGKIWHEASLADSMQ